MQNEHDPSQARCILERLTPEDLELVYASGEVRDHSNGDYIVRQGEPSDGVHVILSGLAESVYQDEAGPELTLSYWSKGDSVGAPNLINPRPHIWSSRAVGPTQVLWLSSATLRRLIAASPSVAIALIEFLSFKAECYAKLAQTLATRSVERRLADVLLSYAGRYGDAQSDGMSFGKVRQHDLAKLVGATRQSVGLALKRWEKLDLIEVCPTKIVVKRLDALKRLAET